MKIRALVFDDDEAVREVMASLLAARGYEVYEFSEPGSCPLSLERECQCPIGHACADFIVSDLKMPNMTGLEFVENQIIRGCKALNFILISGSWSTSEMERAHELGCMTFNKPLGSRELFAWLDQCEKSIDPERKLWDWFRKDPGRADISPQREA